MRSAHEKHALQLGENQHSVKVDAAKFPLTRRAVAPHNTTMKITFYAPLKSPHHPVPSGDRLMSRLLIKAMQLCGHEVTIVSELRSFLREPDGDGHASLRLAASAEKERIIADWRANGRPDIWFCYHPYYKARDLLGPDLCKHFGLPYVTAEASYSERRNTSGWADTQAELLDDLRFAAVNICFTRRDRDGLIQADPDLACTMLPPFIDASRFVKTAPTPKDNHLVTVAMMRSGDKFSSYQALASALALLPQDLDWTLDIVGDGPERDAVQRLFETFDPHRIVWQGEQNPTDVADILSRSSLYVWPGHGEAYGLAYLEAQAAGLPVIAENIAGVPEVVREGETGLLTASGDINGYADAITTLLTRHDLRRDMARKARQFATEERSLEKAAATLNDILTNLPEQIL